MINARKCFWKSLMQAREGEGINSCLLLALQRSLLSFAIQKKIEAEVGADGQGLSMADEISSLIPDRRVGGVPAVTDPAAAAAETFNGLQQQCAGTVHQPQQHPVIVRAAAFTLRPKLKIQ